MSDLFYSHRPFETLSPFSIRFRDLLNEIHVQAQHFCGLHESIEAKLMEPPTRPKRAGASTRFFAQLTNAIEILADARWKYEWGQAEPDPDAADTDPANLGPWVAPIGGGLTHASEGMTLALNVAEINSIADLTNYGQVLEPTTTPSSKATAIRNGAASGEGAIVEISIVPYIHNTGKDETEIVFQSYFEAVNPVEIDCG